MANPTEVPAPAQTEPEMGRVALSTEGRQVRSYGASSRAGSDRGEAMTRSFRQLFDDYGAYVGRSLRYLGVREADLEDATQDVFIVVHRRLDDFEGRSSVKTWLYGIVLRVASEHRRKAYNRKEIATDKQPEQVDVSSLSRCDSRGLLKQLLSALDDDRRALIVMHEIEEFSIPEIAEMMGVPVPTAYTRLRTAKQKLREALQQISRGEAR